MLNHSSPRTGRPTTEESAALRIRVLENALEMLCEVGSDRLVVDHLAEKAGVTKRTIYRQFGSKEGLIEAVVERMIEWLLNAASDTQSEDRDPLAALKIWARNLMDLTILPNTSAFNTFLAFEALNNPALRQKQRQWSDRVITFATELIEKAQATGQLSSASAESAALLLCDLVIGPAYRLQHCVPLESALGGLDAATFFEARWQAFLSIVAPVETRKTEPA